MASKAVVDTLIAEAGGEGEEGLIAAAWAIQQRASARGQTIDQVVKQGFDGYSNPGSAAVRAQGDAALRAKVERIVAGVQSGEIANPVPGADHFLSGDVMPSWAKEMTLVKTVGGHRFYASGNVPDSAQGNSVATQMDVKQPAPAPATPSPAITAARNRQNMAPGADLAASTKTAAAAYLTKDGQGVTDPASIVFGKEMTTRLPQTPGQSIIARVPAPVTPPVQQQPGQSQIERSKPVVAPRAPAVAPASASDKVRGRNAWQTVATIPTVAPRAPVSASDMARGKSAPAPSIMRVAGLAGSVALPASVRPSIPSTDTAPARLPDIPGPNAPPKDQSRLTTVGALDFKPNAGKSALSQEVEVENPAYAALMKRVKQGELELKGMTPSGMPLSRDGRARYDASVKAIQDKLEAQRKQLAETQRTVKVQQSARAPQAARAPVAPAKKVSAVQSFRDQGYSPSDAYDAANRASVERAIANSSNPDQARRLNERLGNI